VVIVMKKRITVVLETESDDPLNMTDAFIESDIQMELSCASNIYDIVSVKQETIECDKVKKG